MRKSEATDWIKKAKSHELYFPTEMQVFHDTHSTVPYVCILTAIKDLALPPPVSLL